MVNPGKESRFPCRRESRCRICRPLALGQSTKAWLFQETSAWNTPNSPRARTRLFTHMLRRPCIATCFAFRFLSFLTRVRYKPPDEHGVSRTAGVRRSSGETPALAPHGASWVKGGPKTSSFWSARGPTPKLSSHDAVKAVKMTEGCRGRAFDRNWPLLAAGAAHFSDTIQSDAMLPICHGHRLRRSEYALLVQSCWAKSSPATTLRAMSESATVRPSG